MLGLNMLSSAYKISYIEFISILIHFLNAPGSGSGSGTVMCPALGNPDNGEVIMNEFGFGAIAVYSYDPDLMP